ncbi:MAG TPA: hypothetical protein VNB89_08915 [Gemmatimonadaceae bacterium]|nr:hypothetical protein [Gemmatimonadaceae bacterium]
MHAPTLRPRSAIEIVDTAFTIWRRNFGQMTIIGIAATVPIVLALVLGLGSLFTAGMTGKSINEGAILSMVPMILVFVVILVLWMAVVDGAMTLAAGDAYFGREVSAASALRGALSKGGTLVLSNILRMLTIGGAAVVGGIVIALLGRANGAIAVLLIVVLSVLMLLLFARLFATTNAVVFENSGASESLNRSFALSKDSAWRIFGVILLSYVVLIVAQIAIGLTVQVVISMVLRSPMVASMVGNVIGALLYPFLSIALMVLYFDQRIRKEGYDLDVLSDGLPKSPAPLPPAGIRLR